MIIIYIFYTFKINNIQNAAVIKKKSYDRKHGRRKKQTAKFKMFYLVPGVMCSTYNKLKMSNSSLLTLTVVVFTGFSLSRYRVVN